MERADDSVEMSFNVNIVAGNAAFADTPEVEIARILGEIAARIESRGLSPTESDSGLVRDINGNRVGGWTWGDAG